MKRRILKIPAQLLIFTLLLSMIPFSKAFAQSTSDVTGTVTDPENKVIAGATVTLKNNDNSLTRTQVTNDRGSFSFNTIPVGTYVLEVEAKGFKKSITSDVQALVAKTTNLVLQLEVGNVTEVVNVAASSTDILVNTTDGSIGNNFVSPQILQLPLNARNVGDLLSLQPAVTPGGYVAGGRSDQANFMLDGVDVNEQQTGSTNSSGTGSTFQPILRVNPDSIEEFRVTTVNANASQGRSSGAQVQLVTKSGTNEFHGAFYEYHRNTVTTATDFFSNKSGTQKPALIRNLFGLSLGGPVIKDRFFFFYNYDGLREAKQETRVRTVPLPSLGAGSVRFFNSAGSLATLTASQINALTSGGLPVVDVNPVGLSVLAAAAAKYPANDTTVGDGLNTSGFRFNAPLPVKLNASTARLDFTLTDKHSLFLRGNYQQDNSAGAPNFPDTPGVSTWS